MYVVSTNTGLWSNEKNTTVRIEFDDDAKQETDAWSGPEEKMLDRCVWRLIAMRWDEIEGEAVCFTVSREEVLQLIRELHELDGISN